MHMICHCPVLHRRLTLRLTLKQGRGLSLKALRIGSHPLKLNRSLDTFGLPFSYLDYIPYLEAPGSGFDLLKFLWLDLLSDIWTLEMNWILFQKPLRLVLMLWRFNEWIRSLQAVAVWIRTLEVREIEFIVEVMGIRFRLPINTHVPGFKLWKTTKEEIYKNNIENKENYLLLMVDSLTRERFW